MNLYDEEQRRKENKKNERIKRIVLSSIILSVILIIALICVIYYLTNNPNRVIVKLDGKEDRRLEEIFEIVTTEDGTISISAPIKEISTYFGYESFNGEYTIVSEDTNSCYVQNDKEIAIFNLDSNIIYKIDRTVNNSEYQYCKIDEPVFQKDGILCVNEQGLEQGFNLYFSYNEKKKIIDIYTLDTLIQSASSRATKYNYTGIDEALANEKAILDNMIVVISADGLYGVIDYSTGVQILDAKYDNITYIPNKKAFLVKKNNKVGIIANDGSTKILPDYDNLTLIDYENGLYLAEKNHLYGVLNVDGEVIIYIEYNKIGIDINQFGQNGIKSGYVLLNNLIPVQQNQKWGFFDIKGKKVTELIYDNIGCITSNSKGTNYNLLAIPEYDVIVVNRNDKYGFIYSSGAEVDELPCVFKDVYIGISSGKQDYYMIWENNEGKDQTYVVGDYIKNNRKETNKLDT